MTEKLVVVVMSPCRLPIVLPFDEGMKIAFEYQDEHFLNKQCIDMFGFYDWLRTNTREIIGLRLAFVGRPSDIKIKNLGKLRGVNVLNRQNRGSEMLIIFFSEREDYSEEASDDQDFGGHRLYHGTNGSLGITFCSPQHLLDV